MRHNFPVEQKPAKNVTVDSNAAPGRQLHYSIVRNQLYHRAVTHCYTLAYIPCHLFSGLAREHSKDTLVPGVSHVSIDTAVCRRRARPGFARIRLDVGFRVPGVSRAVRQLQVRGVPSASRLARSDRHCRAARYHCRLFQRCNKALLNQVAHFVEFGVARHQGWGDSEPRWIDAENEAVLQRDFL